MWNSFKKLLNLNHFQVATRRLGVQRYEYFFNLQIYLQIILKEIQ